MRLVAEWLRASQLKSGPLFGRVVERDSVGDALTAQIVTAVLRKVGQSVGLPAEEWQRISGHSARVGAAQDLLALNIDMASVMQAGRRKDTRIPMRYDEKKYWPHEEQWQEQPKVRGEPEERVNRVVTSLGHCVCWDSDRDKLLRLTRLLVAGWKRRQGAREDSRAGVRLQTCATHSLTKAVRAAIRWVDNSARAP